MKFLRSLKSWFTPRNLIKAIPVITLLGIVTLLFITNYRPGTILSGWDNLHPEFDFWLNIKRSFFAVWQEHQGLGLLGGMAHASDLPRQLFLWFLSIFLPTDSLRYVWTFLMLATGAVGAYYLIKHILNFRVLRKLGEPDPQNDQVIRHSDSPSSEYSEFSEKGNINKLLPFLGGLFYLLNLATIQMFYVPYEAFSAFYGALPWLILASVNYFSSKQHNSRKSLLLLSIVLLLSTPAWYVQTFFIVFLITISIILTIYLLSKPAKEKFIKAIKLYAIIFLINSFWLLPVAYFSITSSSVNINSKINQMGTDSIIAMNKEFGTLPDVMLLKGFSFNSVDPDSEGEVDFMLKPWRAHLNNPLVLVSGFLLFMVVFVGFIKALRSKNPLLKSIAVLFLFSFIALCIDTPPFSYLNSFLRDHIPVVNQIFRFPFTKFATLASLVYAILLAIGTQTMLEKLELRIKNQELRLSYRRSSFLLLASCFLLLAFVTLPAFRGHLFYDKERTKIPAEYNQLFDYFKEQDPNTKIVNFPQQNFWGWSFYDWKDGSYGGSGFLWYGIRQPILDRNFDVWSGTNENFYYEISQALYSKNGQLFEKVLNKYQVNWLLIDKNVFDVASNKTLFVPELEGMLANLPGAKKAAVFGKLEVYKIDLTDKPKDFVFMAKNLPVVNKYNWNNIDQAYLDHGNYISAISHKPSAISRQYPFRSLFTLKTEKEREFAIVEKRANIELTTHLPAGTKGTLSIPSFTEKEEMIPVYLKTEKSASIGAQLVAQVLLPEIILAGKTINKTDAPTYRIQLATVKPEQYPLKINVNGSSFPAVANEDKDIGVAFFIPQTTNVITVSDKNKETVAEIIINPETLAQIPLGPQSIGVDTKSAEALTISIPKIDASSTSFHPLLKDANKVNNCDEFRGKNFSAKSSAKSLSLNSKGATACTAFFAPNLAHDQGFAVFVKSRHEKGQALRFWVENTGQKSIALDTYLPKSKNQTTSSYILSPMEPDGNSYAFHFYNTSIGREETINEINSISAYPVFYDYLKSIQINTSLPLPGEQVDTTGMKVSHPNESLYILNDLPKTNDQRPTTIVLSQAYDSGWRAYQVQSSKLKIKNWLNQAFPFIFGKEIKEHVMVNNWSNGWNLDNSQLSSVSEVEGLNSQLVIVYLPQYLQYLGFILLICTFLFLLKKRRSKKVSNLNLDTL